MNERVVVSSKNVRLIYSNRICCYDDEQTDIRIKLTNKKEDELKLRFCFKYSNSSAPRVRTTANAETGIILELINFNSPFGMGLKKPISLGDLDGKKIFILFNVCKNGEANPILDLSLYMEDRDGK